MARRRWRQPPQSPKPVFMPVTFTPDTKPIIELHNQFVAQWSEQAHILDDFYKPSISETDSESKESISTRGLLKCLTKLNKAKPYQSTENHEKIIQSICADFDEIQNQFYFFVVDREKSKSKFYYDNQKTEDALFYRSYSQMLRYYELQIITQFVNKILALGGEEKPPPDPGGGFLVGTTLADSYKNDEKGFRPTHDQLSDVQQSAIIKRVSKRKASKEAFNESIKPYNALVLNQSLLPKYPDKKDILKSDVRRNAYSVWEKQYALAYLDKLSVDYREHGTALSGLLQVLNDDAVTIAEMKETTPCNADTVPAYIDMGERIGLLKQRIQETESYGEYFKKHHSELITQRGVRTTIIPDELDTFKKQQKQTIDNFSSFKMGKTRLKYQLQCEQVVSFSESIEKLQNIPEPSIFALEVKNKTSGLNGEIKATLLRRNAFKKGINEGFKAQVLFYRQTHIVATLKQGINQITPLSFTETDLQNWRRDLKQTISSARGTSKKEKEAFQKELCNVMKEKKKEIETRKGSPITQRELDAFEATKTNLNISEPLTNWQAFKEACNNPFVKALLWATAFAVAAAAIAFWWVSIPLATSLFTYWVCGGFGIGFFGSLGYQLVSGCCSADDALPPGAVKKPKPQTTQQMQQFYEKKKPNQYTEDNDVKLSQQGNHDSEGTLTFRPPKNQRPLRTSPSAFFDFDQAPLITTQSQQPRRRLTLSPHSGSDS